MDIVATAKHCSLLPALFLHAQGDQLVAPLEAQALFDAYAAPKKLLVLGKGSHNTLRGLDLVDPLLLFLFDVATPKGLDRAPQLQRTIAKLTGPSFLLILPFSC